MEAIDRIKKFEKPLLNAFDKMVRGINIELTNEFRQEIIQWYKYKKMNERLDRWWFILSINTDETVNLCSTSHTIWNNVKLKDVVL